VELIVNGLPRAFEAPLTAEGLLASLGLDARAVVVEVNRRIIRAADLSGTALAPGDTVELVHFVGGG
jgi:thiamine biosynthesis protein ThiS